MTRFHSLAFAAAACAATLAPVAYAADAAPQSVAGVRLSRLCDQCAVVNRIREETQKGKGSGVGALGGAVAGGVIGNKAGDSTAATVGGAVLGGVLGQQAERQIKKRNVWATRVTFKDGRTKSYHSDDRPEWRVGQVVELDADGKLRRR
jgi:outer membrane lipoprotein SlyB